MEMLIIIAICVAFLASKIAHKKLESEILSEVGLSGWNEIAFYDDLVKVKSRQALEKYDDIKYFKDNKEKLAVAEKILRRKVEVEMTLKNFLQSNEYSKRIHYRKIKKQIEEVLKNAQAYRVLIRYISSAGNNLGERKLVIDLYTVEQYYEDPSLLMSKTEYNKYQKEQQKDVLDKKHQKYYEAVNTIIDYANKHKETLIVHGSQEQLDKVIDQLYAKTVNSIKKIKSSDSEEWEIIGKIIIQSQKEVANIVDKSKKILEYYDSPGFQRIKSTCEVLMSSQREFNEYISEKVKSISQLFGTKTVRNDTVREDGYNYVRTYNKTITPFTAEVSAAVFSSAENSPLEYVVKYFYPNKQRYPEQIRKLHMLMEELETLREAKQIIENYKAEYQKYLGDVPDYVLKDDEAGFYSRLGFANIDESVLTVEYKFVYTSGGGMAQRYFTVPMTEDTIINLIKVLESKLTASAFVKEQRALMTKKLRNYIKSRDNYTCRSCGNSTYAEPNLLLEIDHIVPVAKGGPTEEGNLQTLCWKCNRAKGAKITG